MFNLIDFLQFKVFKMESNKIRQTYKFVKKQFSLFQPKWNHLRSLQGPNFLNYSIGLLTNRLRFESTQLCVSLLTGWGLFPIDSEVKLIRSESCGFIMLRPRLNSRERKMQTVKYFHIHSIHNWTQFDYVTRIMNSSSIQ